MNPDSSPRSVDQRPWYRQFWPWFLIFLPATAVVGGIATLIIAVKNADDVVVDDWYKQGRGINRSMAEEQLAARLGLGATLTQATSETVHLRMLAATPIPWPESLSVSLRHPTLSDQDRTLSLSHREDGLYQGTGALTDGAWDITITPPAGQWRLYQRIAVRNQTGQAGAPH